MLNILSILFGLVALAIAIPSTLPLLGWGNWAALTFAVTGAGLGALSARKTGRNFNLVVIVIAAIRLSLGGGVI